MNAYSMMTPKDSNDYSIHTYGLRACARTRRLLRCVVLVTTVAIPCAALLAASPEPVELGTAADFGALAGGAITGTGHVEGDIGSGTGALAPAITATGTIYPTGAAAVMTALDDYATAYNAGKNRAYDVELSAAAYELGGTTLTPGVYKIGAAATVATPVTLDAEGDPEAVFIIQIAGAFGTTAATGNVIVTNNAQSANIFWIVDGAVSMGAGTHMEGTILAGTTITFGATTTMNGRALAGTAAGTVALADTTLSAVTGTPPVGTPPPIVVADTVTDATGTYRFENVSPGTYIVRWDLSSVTTNYGITAAGQGGDDMLDSDGVSGDVGGFVYSMEIAVLAGTTHLGVDLGLVETLPAIKAAALDELATPDTESWSFVHAAELATGQRRFYRAFLTP